MSDQIRKIIIGSLITATVGLIVFGFIITRKKVQNGEKGLPVFDLFFPAGRDKGLIEEKPVQKKTEEKEVDKQAEKKKGEEVAALKLRQLTEEPVAGFGLIGDKIRYVEKATGHVYETNATATTPVRLSNTTVPKIQEAYFSKSGGAAIFRYTKGKENEVENILVRISSTTEVTSRLPGSLTSAVANPKKDSFFYLERSGEGSVGTLLDLDKNLKNPKKKTVFTSPASEWLAAWITEGNLLLSTKPSSEAPGFAYFLNPASGSLQRLAGDKLGMTALASPDAKKILLNDTKNNRLDLSLLDIKTGESAPLATESLPEKCVWSASDKNILFCAVPRAVPPLSYPDAWYRGDISFVDDFWKLNLDTEEDELVTSPADNIDAVNLQLSPKEDLLYFINKRDGTLWTLGLK